jgi:hypothetical protein
MLPVEFEPTIPANARPQAYVLDRAANGIGHICIHIGLYNTAHAFYMLVNYGYRHPRRICWLNTSCFGRQKWLRISAAMFYLLVHCLSCLLLKGRLRPDFSTSRNATWQMELTLRTNLSPDFLKHIWLSASQYLTAMQLDAQTCA